MIIKPNFLKTLIDLHNKVDPYDKYAIEPLLPCYLVHENEYRNLVTGELERHSAHCVVLATGGYGNVFYLSTNAMGCNVTAAWKAVKKGALMANPCFGMPCVLIIGK